MTHRIVNCHCGKSMKALGWASHAAICPVEQARQRAYIECVEQRVPNYEFVPRIAAAVEAAKVSL